jgi:hypothetical protein
MAILVPSAFFQNRTDHSAVTHRLMVSSLMPSRFNTGTLKPDGGVRTQPASFKVLAQSTPDMTVKISRGLGIIGGGEANTQGAYVISNDADISPITIGASHATLQRVDIIYITAKDAIYSGALNEVNHGIIVGVNNTVGSAVPNTGALPASVEELAYVTVDPGVTSITQAKITDRRRFLRGPGGIALTRSFQQVEWGVDYGDVRYWNGRLEGWNAEATTGWRPLGVDNVQYVTTGFTYGSQTASMTSNIISVPDPGYPYYLEGEFSAHTFPNVAATRWDLVVRLDSAAGTVLANGIETNAAGARQRTPWFRTAALTGAHSIYCRFEKLFGGDGTINSEGVVYLRVVPQPPAANNGNLITY